MESKEGKHEKQEEGFTRVMRLPAPSGFFAYGANMLSEVVLNLNDLTKAK